VRLLADSHVVLWLTRDPGRLSDAARTAAVDRRNELLVSAVSAWELSLKHHLGKLPQAEPLLADWAAVLTTLDATSLAVADGHAVRAGQLDWEHRDPFDRMLAAQALIEDAALVSADRAFDNLPGLRRLW
jgi:PIN domain nuclease of toxin-antitoxin system